MKRKLKEIAKEASSSIKKSHRRYTFRLDYDPINHEAIKGFSIHVASLEPRALQS